MKTLNKVVRLACLSILLMHWLVTPLYAATPAPTQVEIIGVDEPMEANIRASLSLLNENADFAPLPEHLAEYQQRCQQEILFALQSYGYYSAKVESNIIIDNNSWKAKFTIHLGPPITIQQMYFELTGAGKNDFKLNHLLHYFPLHSGNIFDHELYEQGKKALLSKVIQAGYLNALFSEHRVEVDLERHQCNIFLTLFTGKPYTFDLTNFESTLLSPTFLNRYLPFGEGEIYDPEKLLTLQSHLQQSDYFSHVNVKALTSEENSTVPIKVELTDAKPNHYLLGAGYGTDTGIRGKIGWTRRRVNSYGHKFSAQAKISEIYDKYEADYTIPGKHPATDYFKIKMGLFEDEYSEKRTRIYETGLSQVQQIHHDWQRQLNLSYFHERYNAFMTNEIIQSKLVLPSITFIQIKRDDATAPTHGRRIEVTLRGGVDALLSDTTFLQGYLQVKWLHTFNSTLKTLVRAELGATLPNDVEDLPLSQRFFAGGDASLRGFGYRTLPYEVDKNGTTHPAGGAYLAVGSIELIKTLREPFGMFTFLDVGNAFRRVNNQIELGTGIGVEWHTRLGPIKIAIAKPLTKDKDAWRIHASFGPEL